MGGDKVKEEAKITLPKSLQIEMLKFFLRTSIPKKKKQLPPIKNDRSGE
jgi:hypothetical protein